MFKNYKSLLNIIIGSSVLSFGLYNVHTQSGITEGGALGLELLLQHWFNISPSISALFIDLSLYALGLYFLGKTFFKNALIATICYSISYAVWEMFPPLLPNLSNYPFVATILGGVFVGIGCGLVIRQGGACGGDDAFALVVNKLTKIPIQYCYLFADISVLLLSLTYIAPNKIFWSLLSVNISSYILGKIVNHQKADITNLNLEIE